MLTNGFASIKDMKRAIKIAESRNDKYIGIEENKLWSGGTYGDYFRKTEICLD